MLDKPASQSATRTSGPLAGYRIVDIVRRSGDRIARRVALDFLNDDASATLRQWARARVVH